MTKVFRIAWRDFVATVVRKSFLIGVAIVPLMMGAMILLLPLLINEQAPEVSGHVAVIDRSGSVAEELQRQLSPEAIAARRAEDVAPLPSVAVPPIASAMVNGSPPVPGQSGISIQPVPLEGALGLNVVILPKDADLDTEKSQFNGTHDRLALIVVHPDAIRRAPGQTEFGTYDLFVREKLDDRVQREIEVATRRSIVRERILALDLDPDEVRSLTRVERTQSTVITEQGERTNLPALNALLPAGFMLLLLVTVLSGGGQLMTTTIEEKSNRIVEVLLSAVSPMELMTGKILGQLFVGLVVMVIYGGMGMAAAASFALQGLFDPWLLLYLLIFYLISYFVIGSFMAAIGAAVTDLRDAQSLMRPVMIVLMVPWLMWMPIARDPNSALAVISSFVPPVNTFAMLLRMSSTSPPPLWQVWLSIGIGLVSAYVSLWFAAKVFRIGLLEFGKAPDFRTLLRWAREA